MTPLSMAVSLIISRPTPLWKANFIMVLAHATVLLTSPIAAALPTTLHVALDPGHGGLDKGAIHSSIKESELVLRVANKVKSLLEKNENVRVTMTRSKDQSVSLSDRVKIAEASHVDIFVSLHANAANDQRAKGIEFFFQNNLPPDEESLYLANLENQSNSALNQAQDVEKQELSKKGDISAIIEDLHRQNKMMSSLRFSQTLNQFWQSGDKSNPATIKQAPFYVISKTTMPAVLIEVGFLTHPKEVKQLAKPEYQDQIAEKISNAILTFKEKMDKPELRTLN
jgi:N-acetylmuramoyl-L-alanine amidase